MTFDLFFQRGGRLQSQETWSQRVRLAPHEGNTNKLCGGSLTHQVASLIDFIWRSASPQRVCIVVKEPVWFRVAGEVNESRPDSDYYSAAGVLCLRWLSVIHTRRMVSLVWINITASCPWKLSLRIDFALPRIITTSIWEIPASVIVIIPCGDRQKMPLMGIDESIIIPKTHSPTLDYAFCLANDYYQLKEPDGVLRWQSKWARMYFPICCVN